MSDQDPLARKLTTLTAKDIYDGKALRLCKSGTPDAMQDILQAIDDTMMLRDAVFAVGTSAVTLRISGKRVLGVVSVTDGLGATADLIGHPLTPDDTTGLAQVEKVLDALTAQSGTLTLERKAANPAIALAGSGVGIQALSAGWGAEPVPEVVDPMGIFVSGCTPASSAIISLDNGEVEKVGGDAAAVDTLQSVLDDKWDTFDEAYEAFYPASTEPQLRILDGLAPDGHALVVAIIDEKQCLAIVSTAKIPQVAAAWGAALGA